MENRIELIDGTNVPYDVFEVYFDDDHWDIYENGFVEKNHDFFQQHFNEMIEDGYGEFLFEGLDKIIEKLLAERN